VLSWSLARDKFGYIPSRNLEANHCEFFIDGTFGRTFAHGQAYSDTLEFYFQVDLESLVEDQHGQILNLAAYVLEQEGAHIVKAKDNKLPICPTGRCGKLTAEFAFFLDVRRGDRSVDRLWLKNGNRNFTIPDDIASYIIWGRGLGAGSEYYIAADSPLFNQKKACRR
jgi:hypothetical protein